MCFISRGFDKLFLGLLADAAPRYALVSSLRRGECLFVHLQAAFRVHRSRRCSVCFGFLDISDEILLFKEINIVFRLGNALDALHETEMAYVGIV